MKRRLSGTNFSSENNLPNFDWMLQSSSGRKVQTNITICSHAPLRIHVIWGHRSVRIVPPSLLPYHSSTATTDFQSSIPVEVVTSGCAGPPSPTTPVLCHGCFLPVDRMVILSCMLHYSWFLHHPPLAGILIFFLQSHLQSPSGLLINGEVNS